MSREYVTLLGTEDVARASHGMQSAASDMLRAVQYLDEILSRHRALLDETVGRFEAAAEKLAKSEGV